MRIIIVEDEPAKLFRISEVIRGALPVDIQLDHAADATTARRHLRDYQYDLLVLDLAIPQRVGDHPRPEIGIRLLQEINERPGYQMPAQVVGITALEEARQEAGDLFAREALSLLNYDPGSDAWVEQLQARVRHGYAAKTAASSAFHSEYRSYLGIICALEVPELAQIRRLWPFRELPLGHDQTMYWEASVTLAGHQRRIIAAASGVGMPAAAVLATKMIYEFRPEYLAMTGITAALPQCGNLGDVLVVDRSWDWGAGKWQGEDGTPATFEPAPHQFALSPDLRNKFFRLSAERHALLEIKAGWPDAELSPYELAVHVGPVASGAAVVASSETANLVLNQNRKTIGIEMEAYGIFCAGSEVSKPRPQIMVLKSVVDFANSAKADTVRAYAAYTSAQVLRLFVERFL